MCMFTYILEDQGCSHDHFVLSFFFSQENLMMHIAIQLKFGYTTQVKLRG